MKNQKENIKKSSLFVNRLHKILIIIPQSLKIKKNDFLEMHNEIDEKANFLSLSYWLLIIISCGIATLGLIINSPAVIIGAMLVAPLMRPILGLGMGIAISDLYLSIKSILNILFSFLATITTAALITILVPLYDITPEILARTSPTVLDLFIAVLAGLVAALGSIRVDGKDLMGDVAAGAAIGVALMPPLSVVGYGIGIGFNFSIIWGAFLLFLTNLFGIVMISSLFYYIIYEGYDIQKLVNLINQKREKTDKMYLKLNQIKFYHELTDKIFSKKRFLFPLFLILIISYPLSSSLSYIKQVNSIKKTLESTLRETKNIQIIRGVESLNFSKNSVSGTVFYSSEKNLGPQWDKEIIDRLQNQFPDFKINIRFVRIVHDSQIQPLLSLHQNIDEKTINALKEEFSKELLKKILDTIKIQFPKSVGVILNISAKYSLIGLEEIILDVAGKRLNRESLQILKQSLIQGLLNNNVIVNDIKINFLFSNPKEIQCNKKNYLLNDLIDDIHNSTLLFLKFNTNLVIDVYLDKEIYQVIQSQVDKSINNINYFILEDNPKKCKAIIYYYQK